MNTQKIRELNAEKLSRKVVFKCGNGNLLQSSDGTMLRYETRKNKNEDMAKSCQDEIEQYQKELDKCDDLFEMEMLRMKIAKAEKDFNYWNSEKMQDGKYMLAITSDSMLSQIEGQIRKVRNNDNIRAILRALGFRFSDKKNNLSVNLSNEELDRMTMSEALTYSPSDNLPRTRELIESL